MITLYRIENLLGTGAIDTAIPYSTYGNQSGFNVNPTPAGDVAIVADTSYTILSQQPGIHSYDNKTSIFNIASPGTAFIRNQSGVTSRIYEFVSLHDPISFPGGLGQWVPVGTGCDDYRLTVARSQEGGWLDTTSVARGTRSEVKLTNIPLAWMDDNWRAIETLLTSGPFILRLDDTRHFAMCWLDGGLSPPTRNSVEHVDFQFRIAA